MFMTDGVLESSDAICIWEIGSTSWEDTFVVCCACSVCCSKWHPVPLDVTTCTSCACWIFSIAYPYLLFLNSLHLFTNAPVARHSYDGLSFLCYFGKISSSASTPCAQTKSEKSSTPVRWDSSRSRLLIFMYVVALVAAMICRCSLTDELLQCTQTLRVTRPR